MNTLRKEKPIGVELYSREVFQVLLEYEINRSRRYPASVALINILVKIDPNMPETQAGADKAIKEIFNANLRGADIPAKNGNEYLILLPTIDEAGARIVCERLLNLMKRTHQTSAGKMFNIIGHAGIAILESSVVSGAVLMSQSARALSAARAQGLSTYSVFEDHLNS